MSALPPTAAFQTAASADAGPSSTFDERGVGGSLGQRVGSTRWIGWRLRGLVVAALVGCLAVFLLIRTLAALPGLTLPLSAGDNGALLLADTTGALRTVRGVVDTQGRAVSLDTLALQRSARWLVNDAERAQHAAQRDALARALAAGSPRLVVDEGQLLAVDARAMGAASLGAMFWLAATLALLLYLVAMVVVTARPEPRNLLYAVLSLAQVGNLLFLAAESVPGFGLPAGFMRWDYDLRCAFDLTSAAALVHATALHPRRLQGSRARVLGVWLATAALALAIAWQLPAASWWWTQAAMLGCSVLAAVQLGSMQRPRRHPLAVVLWRFCALALGTLVLLTLTVAALDPRDAAQGQALTLGSVVWMVFAATLLLMLPFLARTQQLMREFSLLAGVSAVATSLDLLFVAVFSLGSFASLTLALFIALGVYAGVRQWLLNQMMARERITTERMFEHLYRMVRSVQSNPQAAGDQLALLLRELFDPLDVRQVARQSARARVVGDGASLLVPVPQLTGDASPSVIVLGYARRGRRMFTADDARLAERVVDQWSRAVAFARADERGRSEERVRIAQDLHDDIGARLLTLMYQAPTREMEDYVRHTLKDLKTLTRGLAAPSHRLSHAVAEWKADIAQRLAAADCELSWSFAYDGDFELGVVQWSALTRVLRELVSNAIAHARASRVDIDASLEGGLLTLSVSDNGAGRNPQAWAHGLGLGGVRKRVKQLGGNVQWRENGERGIVCRVVIAGLGVPGS